MGVHDEGDNDLVAQSVPDVSPEEAPPMVPYADAHDVNGPPELPSGANRPGWLDLAAVLGIVWSVEIFGGVIVALVSIAKNGMPAGPDGLDFEPWAIIATAPLSALATIIACWYFACRRHNRTFRDGLYVGSVPGQVVLSSLVLGLVCAVIGGIVMSFFSTGGSQLESLLLRPSADDPDKMTLFYPLLVLFVLFPVLEELYYRGFLFSVLERLLGLRWSFAIVVIWFGLIHAPQLVGDLAALPVVTVMGVVFTWLRYKHGSILPGIVCHCAYNGVLVTVTVVQVYVQNR